MNNFNYKERRQNFMSYMITVKTSKGVVMASDSYSCYFHNREIKDSHYKKIHEIIPHRCYIGLTGLNEVYRDNKNHTIDINDTVYEAFKHVNKANIYDKTIEYGHFLKRTTDRLGQDIRVIVVFEDILYYMDIRNNQDIVIQYLDENSCDAIFSGEEMYAINGAISFKKEYFDISLKELKNICIESVKRQIQIENMIQPEGKRIIGGDIQYIVLDYDAL